MARSKALVILLMATTLVLVACGDDDQGGAVSVADGGEVVIELSEYQFSPNAIEVTAGSTVTFVVRNTGQLRHEFMIGRDVRVVDGVKDGFQHNFFENMEPLVVPADAAMDMEEMNMGTDSTMGDMSTDTTMGDMGEHGFMIVREPEQEARITITVPVDAVGSWEFGCFVEDGAHYEKGMVGTLTVVAS